MYIILEVNNFYQCIHSKTFHKMDPIKYDLLLARNKLSKELVMMLMICVSNPFNKLIPSIMIM